MPTDGQGLTWFYIMAGVFGLLIGSFLNVCILSWGAEPKESVMRPRSRCPKCGNRIAWYDNIPVLSWLILRGRCRNCKQSISLMYPLVELATCIIWIYFVWLFGPTIAAVRAAVFFTLLLGILVTDARAYIIPDEFTIGGLVLGLILTGVGGFILNGGPGAVHGLAFSFIGGAVGFGILWVVGWLGTIILKQDAMGGGDIKMMAMVGVFVGWTGVLLTIFIGALVGTLVFLPLTLMGRKKLVPFGIFLAIGAGVAYLFGAKLVQWYAITYLGA